MLFPSSLTLRSSIAMMRGSALAGQWKAAAAPCCAPSLSVSRRSLHYSPLDTLRPKSSSSGRQGQVSKVNDGAPNSPATASRHRAGAITGAERPFNGTRMRPAAAGAQQRAEARQIFPKTLPSGRPEQQYTVSQQLFYKANPSAAAAVEEQQLADRRLLRAEEELKRKRREMDRRFFRRWSDYREIEDSDPYCGSGKLFNETSSTSQLRLSAWQAQFEKENEDCYLPYERTTVLRRLAPNWFVRYFVSLRDSGGADHVYHLVLIGTIAGSLLLLVGYLFYTAPSRAKPVKELR